MRRHASICCALAIGLVAFCGSGPAAAAGCPNESIRLQQGTTDLPDCRAFEQVSPADKGLNEVDWRSPGVQAAPDGGRVIFSSLTAFPGTQSSVIRGTYLARRGDRAWGTESIDPVSLNQAEQLLQATPWISEDLSHGLDASRMALAPEAAPESDHVYLHDLSSGERQVAVQVPSRPLGGLFPAFVGPNSPVWGATPDLSHFTFGYSGEPLVPGAPEGVSTAYEWADGDLRLIARGLDGTPIQTSTSSLSEGRFGRNQLISSDGSRIYFMDNGTFTPSNGNGVIYLREDGVSTKLISASQQTGADPNLPIKENHVWGMSDDGRYLFFSTQVPMNDEPVVPATRSGYSLLYRYDLAKDDFTLVADGGTDPSSNRILGWAVARTGERIYFQYGGQLTPTSPPTGGLYVWDADTGVRFVGPEDFSFGPVVHLSRDGRYAAILTVAPLAGPLPTGNPNCPAGRVPFPETPAGKCGEVYAYDAESGNVACVSCPPVGESKGHAQLGIEPQRGQSRDPRAVLDDGTVFFDTPNRLVPEDVNGVRDVYEWHDGAVRLLTGGTDVHPASFADASADGSDVYFLTRAQLVAQDTDNALDVYDVRKDGGLEIQNQVNAVDACEGESCQGSLTGAAAAPAAGSRSVFGPSSQRSKRKARCRTVRHHKAKRGRVSRAPGRCVAKKERRAGRAGMGSRGSR